MQGRYLISLARSSLSGLPGKKMLEQACRKIKDALITGVIAFEEREIVPRFKESFPRSCIMVLICEDEESEICVDIPEEVKVIKVTKRLLQGMKIPSDFLKLVHMWNVVWTLVMILKQLYDDTLILGLYPPSVNTLEHWNFRLPVGVRALTFKVFGPTQC